MSGLFGRSSPSPPAPKPVVPMPDEESPEVKEAERRRRALIGARGGRDSTRLSDNTNTFLGPHYKRTLGGG